MPNTTAFTEGLTLATQIIGQMGLLVFIGFLMVKKQWLSSQTLTDLTKILIDGVIPCAFILAMVRSFTPALIKEGAILMLVVTAWIVAAWAFGAIWYRLFPSGKPTRDRSVTAMLMISNSIYLPLPVILAMTPESMHDQATVYISVSALPSMAFMWTVCVVLLSGDPSKLTGNERKKLIFNAPLIAIVIGIILSFIPGMTAAAKNVPGSPIPLKMIFAVMGYMSQTLSPLAMLILGGFIASSKMTERFRVRHVLPLIGIRLFLAPMLVYCLIHYEIIKLPPLAAMVLLLAAAAPPATNHSLIARKYDGEWQLVSSLQLLVHAVALFTLPFWLTLGMGF